MQWGQDSRRGRGRQTFTLHILSSRPSIHLYTRHDSQKQLISRRDPRSIKYRKIDK